MTYISHKRKILNVLVENENGFLSPEKIARLTFPGTIAEQGKKGLKGSIDTVRRNMGHVIELAAQNDLIIISKKAPIVGNDNRYFKIIGYKLVTKNDKKWIDLAIDSKESKVHDYIESFNLFSNRLVERELLEVDEVKKLN